jgi:hypothetical protein
LKKLGAPSAPLRIASQHMPPLHRFSAAHWLAPYGRTGTQYFYADDAGLVAAARTASEIVLQSTKGENVVSHPTEGFMVFSTTAIEPAPGAICTSPVQTYLDLGRRWRARAERRPTICASERLTWPK